MLISRLSASAALFAVLATGSIAIAADRASAQPAATPAVVQLPAVVVTGQRLVAEAR